MAINGKTMRRKERKLEMECISFLIKKRRREKMKMEMRYRSARSSLVADDELKSSSSYAAETNPTGKSESATRTKIPLQRESSKSGWRASEEEIGTSSSSEELRRQIRSSASSMMIEFPRITTIPICCCSPVFFFSMASSMTRFMKGSYPRKIPDNWRPPLI